MAGEPDVRLEGTSHAQILAWVKQGKADKSTEILERRMQSIVNALTSSGDEVNKAVQQANAGDWDGSTARSATTAMSTLRDYDDDLHTHGTNSRYSAMGQSGQSSVTRDKVPPLSSLDLDGTPTIASQTADPKARIVAKRNAEDQAREAMAEYHAATQQRVSSMPAVLAVPKVVLDTGNDSSPGGGSGSGGSSSSGGHTRPPATATPTSPIHSPVSGSTTTSHRGSVPAVPGSSAPQGTSTSSVASPPTVATPGPVTNYPTGQPSAVPPGGGNPPNPNGIGPYGGSPGSLGGYRENSGSGSGSDASGGRGGAGAGADPEGGVPRGGPRSGAGMAAAEESALGRRALATGGRPGGAGTGGMLGGGAGANGGNDEEHSNRYGLPSDEYFEDEDDEDFLLDPRNRDFYVAPDVIGGPE